ncbi:MAG: amino acid permease [Cytophagales bacterium]|nr:MAG: amino acid permease [Cytophagales bacterium]
MSPTSGASTAQLKRSIGLVSAIALVISNIIGTGVFKKVVPMAAELQSPNLILLAWLLAGLLSLSGTLSNAEVASMLADSGGEYVYFRKIYGRFFAFLFGWTQFAVIRTAAIASIAYVFAQSLNSLIALPDTPANLAEISLFGIHPLDNLSVKLVTIALVWLLTYANVRGVSIGEKISNSLTVLMIAVMVFLIVTGLFASGGSWSNLSLEAAPPTGGSLVSALGLACLSAFWAYEGWASVGYIGGELKDPQRNLPRALTIGCVVVMSIYLLMNLVYVRMLPINELIALKSQPNTIGAVVAVGKYLGVAGSLLVSCLILVTTFNCTSSSVLTASRLFYAMARDGQFFRAINYVHPTHQTPSRSLILQAVWTTVMVLSGSFDQLTDMLIFASFIFYGATAVGVFVLRSRMPDAPRPYRVIGYPVVPAIFILFCGFLVISTLFNRPTEALVGLGLMATGLPFYFLWSRKI